jgi:hypothetical protein
MLQIKDKNQSGSIIFIGFLFIYISVLFFLKKISQFFFFIKKNRPDFQTGWTGCFSGSIPV